MQVDEYGAVVSAILAESAHRLASTFLIESFSLDVIMTEHLMHCRLDDGHSILRIVAPTCDDSHRIMSRACKNVHDLN